MRGRVAIGAAAVSLVMICSGTAITWAAAGSGARSKASRVGVATVKAAAKPLTTVPAPTTAAPSTTIAPPSTTSTTVPPPTTVPVRSVAAAQSPVPLAGCPVAPQPPVASSPPWHPAVLVPDSALPSPVAPASWRSNLAPISGTGMWIWQWTQTDRGDAAAVVTRASAAHLHQLWVRVGDSKNGFYGAQELAQLVPAAHAAGLSVIAWGFPYLYNPVGDAAWSQQILAWRSPGGQAVDGFSADIERSSEGVDLTSRRAAVYLGNLRRAAGARTIVATVYPPTDAYWTEGGYPYRAMAPYVDAFAPMIYWECTDPGTDASFDVTRLATLRPVHIIGQAFNMADVGGRAVAPSSAEIREFLGSGKKAGAVGASLWVWQDATPEEWGAIGGFVW